MASSEVQELWRFWLRRSLCHALWRAPGGPLGPDPRAAAAGCRSSPLS